MSLKNSAFVTYFRKSYEELEKVTWMTKKQMVISSILVISISILVTGIITLLDYLFNNGYLYLLENFTS